MKKKRRLTSAVGALLAAAIAGGVAYASIPGPGNVYSACMLKGIGTIRLIDKSLPSTNLVSHCTDKETEISWNQAGQPGPAGPQGAKGDPGATGTNGTNGKDGASVTTAAEPTGVNCAEGGVQLTAANGVSYVCNGKQGTKGEDGVSVTSAVEPAGTNCANGGSKFTAANGVAYACNGDPGAVGFGGTVFGSAVLLNADPPVTVYDNPALGRIEVGCVVVSSGGVASIQPQVAFWNNTSQTLSVNMLTSGLHAVAPGGRAFLVEDGTSWIGPDASTLPGAERGSVPNSVAVTRPFAKVDVTSRVPFPVTVLGVSGGQGCAYTVAVTASP